MTHGEVMNQVRDIILVGILRCQFHKERSGIVKEVVPIFLFFVSIGLERNKIGTQCPSQKFQLIFRILEVFDIVNAVCNRLVQFFGAM